MINAVVINHNTSAFTELAVRSYFAMHSACTDWKLVILDNSSTDQTKDLKGYAQSLGVEFRQTGWDVERRQANSHGEVLRQFVMAEGDCDYYLLLDSDICFVMPNTIDRMIREIKDRDDAWAIHARDRADASKLFEDDEKVLAEDLSQYRSKERAQENKVYLHYHKNLSAPAPEDIGEPLATMVGTVQPRCFPWCTLVKNSKVFRRVTERIGFSCAWMYEDRLEGAGYYDTMGLMAAVMTTHGKIYLTSSRGVLHFGEASYGASPVKGTLRAYSSETLCRMSLL